MPRPYDLASMTALVSFEAAARHASFKKAAHELNVTAAAISHQVKALEADLGCGLFRRQYRGVDLTEKGAFLFAALRRGFDGISDAVGQVRVQPDATDVTIATTTAVSALWLTPRIIAFWRSHPEITISQIVSDVPVAAGRADLSVSYGEPRAGSGDRELFQDRILALGTPAFAAQHDIAGLADLARVPFIHSSDDETGWTTWDDWFAALGYPAVHAGGRFHVNNYMIGLQAAQDGVGAVLGWERLVAGLLAERRLVQLVADHVLSPTSFLLRVHAHASARARVFADWLAMA